MASMRKRGFTIVELVVTLAVLSIILVWAVPSFRSITQNARVTSQANEFITSLNLARSEALKRQVPVSIAAASGGTIASEFGNGWSVFVDFDGDGAVDASDITLATNAGLQGGLTLNSVNDISSLTYRADGTIAASRSFQVRIAECRGMAARDVVVSRIGHAQVTTVSC